VVVVLAAVTVTWQVLYKLYRALACTWALDVVYVDFQSLCASQGSIQCVLATLLCFFFFHTSVSDPAPLQGVQHQALLFAASAPPKGYCSVPGACCGSVCFQSSGQCPEQDLCWMLELFV